MTRNLLVQGSIEENTFRQKGNDDFLTNKAHHFFRDEMLALSARFLDDIAKVQFPKGFLPAHALVSMWDMDVFFKGTNRKGRLHHALPNWLARIRESYLLQSMNFGYPCSISRWVRFFSFPCRFIIPFQQWPMPQMPARLVFQWLPAQYLVFLTARFVDYCDSPHGFWKKSKITTGSTGETSTSLPRNSWSQRSEAFLSQRSKVSVSIPLLGNGKKTLRLESC